MLTLNPHQRAHGQGRQGVAGSDGLTAAQHVFMRTLAEHEVAVGTPICEATSRLLAWAERSGLSIPRAAADAIAHEVYTAVPTREEMRDGLGLATGATVDCWGSHDGESAERSVPTERSEAREAAAEAAAAISRRTSDLSAERDVHDLSAGRFAEPLKTRKELEQLGRDATAVRMWLDTTRPTRDIGEEGPCLLPGHDGAGTVALDKLAGIFKYRCDCAERVWSWLPEVRAAWECGAVEQLGQGERSLWTRRMFYEAGVPMAMPAEEIIAIPPAPEGAPEAAALARDGFVLLVRLKAIGFGFQSVLYGRPFIARWNGLSIEDANAALDFLRAAGVIVRVSPRGKPFYASGLPKGWQP